MKNQIIAACGNDCAACPRYTKHPYEKTEEQLAHAAELWYRIGYRDHIVSIDEVSCTGCTKDSWCRFNVIRCVSEKGIQNCSACESYPCETILECFETTMVFEPACRKACTDEEYEIIRKAFFEKKKNLEQKEK